MSKNLYADVAAFQQKVLGVLHANEQYNTLQHTPGFKTTMRGLREELAELNTAIDNECVSEQTDALIDLIYFALGGLYQMGVPFGDCWDKVHEANMRKVKGKTKRGTECDAAKPKGWTPPTFNLERAQSLPAFTPQDGECTGCVIKAERARYLKQAEHLVNRPVMDVDIPAPLLEVACLLKKKAEDYRTGVRMSAYFPFGHESHATMLNTKNVRIISLVKGMRRGKKANFESLRDSLLDMVSYATFYIQAIDAKEVE